ncbi:2-phosphoxylose phosphatase 1 [Patella vulgata]|uniref:2-phosphoxylose phosphatase 1 n=1 Tax=Patella vulgata TaxID=6465 RepID=UPI00217FB085|nr:2-phosphoxylose phosphatase 1 [Patella vulgata]
MRGLKSKWCLVLSGLLFATGVLYASVSLPSFTYVQADGAIKLEKQSGIFHYKGRVKRSNRNLRNVLIDLEVKPESPYTQNLQELVHHTAPQDILHHPRVQEWCHRPDSTFSGMEGSPVQGYKLSTVLVLVTPGHTVRNLQQGKGVDSSCKLWEFLSKFSDDKLSSYQEMLSIHKNMKVEKGGFKIFNSAPVSGFCKNGELSPLGVSQHIKLGEFIRKAYFTQLKTLKTLPRDTVTMANCVQDQAAYQSTMAFLHGLFSEKQFIKAGIKKVQDNLCNSKNGLPCNCQTLSQHTDFITDPYDTALKYIPDIHTKSNLVYTDTIQKTSNLIAKNLKILNGVSQLCQTNGEICKDNTKCNDMSMNSIVQVFNMLDKSIFNITQSADFVSKSRLYSHPFLMKTVSLLLEPKQDFALYTIKDFLMVNLLVALGIPVNSLPSPASRVAIEVHERSLRSLTRKRVVRVLVNGRDYTPYLTACSADFGPNCDLMLLQGLKLYNYDLECGN